MHPTQPAGTDNSMPVELGYFAIPSPDPGKGAAFWTAVFGWTFAPPDESGYRDIESTSLPGGIGPLPGDRVLTWFRVDAIADSIATVRELGGEAPDATVFPYGLTAACSDDQGIPFNLWQMTEGFFPDQRRGGGENANEPAYFVLPSPDSERGSRFYGALFGWQFEPEGGNGYRHVKNIALPGGIGGLDEPMAVPWFRVQDIRAVVDSVTSHGGVADEPSQSDSGWSATCHDNQGVRLDLWQPAPGL